MYIYVKERVHAKRHERKIAHRRIHICSGVFGSAPGRAVVSYFTRRSCMNSKPLQKDPLTAVRASCLLRSSLLRKSSRERASFVGYFPRLSLPLFSSVLRNKLIESSVYARLRTVTRITRVLIRARVQVASTAEIRMSRS